MTKYLEIEEVLIIHEETIKLFGGTEGILNFNSLHAAVERSKATFGKEDLYPTVFEKAAALLQSLIMNHPFNDGNKRTAITCVARFLLINNWDLNLPIEKSIQFTLDISSHTFSFERTVKWLKDHSIKIKFC